MNAFIIFPHQLFKQLPSPATDYEFILTEDPLFFGDWKYKAKFHKQKLAYHRASLKRYQSYLESRDLKVHYLEYKDNYKKGRSYLFDFLEDKKFKAVTIFKVYDYILELRLKKHLEENDIEISYLNSPMFLDSEDLFNEVFEGKKGYLMASFYKKQRTRLDVLVFKNGKPRGGKWSFDEENRKKLPKNISIPEIDFPRQLEYKKEAIEYTEKHFGNNYGELETIYYPTSFNEAETWLTNFLEERFSLFGDYEDALSSKDSWLFHSVLTPMLNTGLLTPQQVIDAALEYADKNDTPINSVEGFVRQIIGWREYMLNIYTHEGVFMRTENFWDFDKDIPKAFYTAKTGIAPVDAIIKRTLKHAYNHHIERLMILGNFMLLCEINPKQVYKWFMEMYIDAYDWVMVPNVYGMSQYADGGLICTKPYISGSSYVRKMSNFSKGDWCEVWDGLYWRFINKHKEVIKENARMGMMVSMLDKMDKKKLDKHIETAENYLELLNSGKSNKSEHLLV